MTFTNSGGIVGLAWTGTICESDENAYLRASINAYLVDDLISAETVAHEIGHNLNMDHDFIEANGPDDKVARNCPTDGSSCTDINGIMDYYEDSPLTWTCCSRYF